MGLMDAIRRDILQITTNGNDFAEPIVFLSPLGTTVTIKGIVKKIHFALNEEGMPVNSKTASVSVSESALTALDYPVRNAGGEVDLSKHKVSWTDSAGTLCQYVIKEWFPDETVGLIVCILADFGQ